MPRESKEAGPVASFVSFLVYLAIAFVLMEALIFAAYIFVTVASIINLDLMEPLIPF